MKLTAARSVQMSSASRYARAPVPLQCRGFLELGQEQTDQFEILFSISRTNPLQPGDPFPGVGFRSALFCFQILQEVCAPQVCYGALFFIELKQKYLPRTWWR
jgi:hypothetical protein